jgi:hypothetical protein
MSRDEARRAEIIAEINDAWLNIDIGTNKLARPLDILQNYQEDPEEYMHTLYWLMTQPDYLSFFVKEVLNIELLPFQCLIIQEMWKHKFPMMIMTRGGGKSFILALYGLLRALLIPGRKIVAVGAAFRQSKYIHEYMEKMWNGSSILNAMYPSSKYGSRRDIDMCRMLVGTSVISSLPIGTGEKIRGQRANDILSDEFASISRDIFETVIAGFASVTDAPADNVKKRAAEKRAAELGFELDGETLLESSSIGNQVVISGTCDYDFGHFAEYWKRWCEIIKTGGDQHRLERLFGGEVPAGFNWTDYCVFRVPFDAIPEGFMDESQIARAKATVNSGTFQREYGAVFPTDSQGFFKRSVIEKCVAKEENNIELPSGGPIIYDPMLRGNPVRQYVMGVDTASEIDNFAIVIQELHSDHQRIVHCWTTRRDRHKERVKRGLTDEKDFYSYCCRKIRDLMALFNIIHISIDSQGGGIAILEGLHDDDKMREGEVPIWPVIEEGKDKDTDHLVGKHIIEMVNFASADWTGEANHGLAKDFEDRFCLFPRFDMATLGLAAEQDKLMGRGDADADIEGLYDTLEDCVMEIEELKNELSIIEITKTASGRDRWDTPEIQTGIKKKERLRKDRYSALIMCNMAARQRGRVIQWTIKCEELGGFAVPRDSQKDKPTVSYSGPEWFTSKVNGAL